MSISIPRGSATLITGPSGCGKSTALRLMNGLIPHVTDGALEGRVVVDGLDVAGSTLEELGQRTATVFQNPRNQFFAATVLEELAFARQQAGQDREEILGAAHGAARRVGIDGWLERSLWDMSGGELQAVACATALAGTGDIYLFDEPTSNLSERAIVAISQILGEMKRAGATLVIAEHRLYFLRDIVDTVITMEAGRVLRTWTAEEFFATDDAARRAAGWRTLTSPELALVPAAGDKANAKGGKPSPEVAGRTSLEARGEPTPADAPESESETPPEAASKTSPEAKGTSSPEVASKASPGGERPQAPEPERISASEPEGVAATEAGGRLALENIEKAEDIEKSSAKASGTNRPGTEATPAASQAAPPPAGLTLRDLRYSYGHHLALDVASLHIPKGSVTALMGDNGAGKTTLCRVITGLAEPERTSTIEWDDKRVSAKARRAMSSIVMQDVNRQLFAETVLGEVTMGTKQARDVDPRALLERLGLEGYAGRHPMSLSGGQKQRLVIAAALAARSKLVVFDEPTSGVDYRHMLGIGSLIRELAAGGIAVLVVSHDREFVAACADRVVRLSAPGRGKASGGSDDGRLGGESPATPDGEDSGSAGPGRGAGDGDPAGASAAAGSKGGGAAGQSTSEGPGSGSARRMRKSWPSGRRQDSGERQSGGRRFGRHHSDSQQSGRRSPGEKPPGEARPSGVDIFHVDRTAG
ncbi:MAG: ATP-binding cassette domain-containing protein [Actinomycetaceae bacterium]|nr:ATP-binding cassette domain-containing protein [Actinomycetaceae bacterium]